MLYIKEDSKMTEKTIISFEDFDNAFNDEDLFLFDELKYILYKELKKTKIQKAVLIGKNMTWRSSTGHSRPFELTADTFLSNLSFGHDYSLEIKKIGHKIVINRISHDEPTGATLYLVSESVFNKAGDDWEELLKA